MMRSLLEALARLLPEPRVILDRDGKSPYLSRYYLLGYRREVDGEVAERSLPFNLFLHKFHRSDDADALHSHPWDWAVSLVLAGGYLEERRVGTEVVGRAVLPFSLNVLRHDTYHRVELYQEDAWSLFLVGPKRQTWYFWDRERKARCRYKEFVEKVDAWTPDP